VNVDHFERFLNLNFMFIESS